MLPLALVLSAVGLGLLANGLLKVLRFDSFVEAVTRYAPTARPSLVAAAWAASEMAAAVFLLTPLWFRVIPTAWLMAAATGGLTRRLSQGEAHDCGCTSRTRKVSPAVVRNNSVLLVSLLIAQGFWGGAASLGAGLVGALVLFQLGFLAVGSDHAKPGRPSMPHAGLGNAD
jgi:hypothetical protein